MDPNSRIGQADLSAKSLSELVSLREAAKLFPCNRLGKRPHLTALYRWTTSGKRGVVLASWLAGTCRCTTPDAVAEFIDQVSKAARLSSPQLKESAAEHATASAGERLRDTFFRRRGR